MVGKAYSEELTESPAILLWKGEGVRLEGGQTRLSIVPILRSIIRIVILMIFDATMEEGRRMASSIFRFQ